MTYNLETAMTHCYPHKPQVFCNEGSWSLTHCLTSKQFPRLTINLPKKESHLFVQRVYTEYPLPVWEFAVSVPASLTVRLCDQSSIKTWLWVPSAHT